MTVPSRLPVVQAPMAGGLSTLELAAAVNAAGGFGYVAAGCLTLTRCASRSTAPGRRRATRSA